MEILGLREQLTQAGHAVVSAAPVLNTSPWEGPVKREAPVLHLPLGPEAQPAIFAAACVAEPRYGLADSREVAG